MKSGILLGVTAFVLLAWPAAGYSATSGQDGQVAAASGIPGAEVMLRDLVGSGQGELQSRETTVKRPTRTGNSGATVKKPTSSKKETTVSKPTKKKKKKKAKKAYVEPKSSMGVRASLTPISDMNFTTEAGVSQDADMRLGYGFGLQAEHRFITGPDLYILGEFMYYSMEIYELGGESYKANAKDSLIKIATGLKFNLLGGVGKSSDRVFLKGIIGYSYYAGDDGNTDSLGGLFSQKPGNRSGLFGGGGVGIEHYFGTTPFSAFADTGIYFHSFSMDPAGGEKESDLTTWEVSAGVLYHF